MEFLKTVFEQQFQNVRTYIQSGNVCFDTDNAIDLEQRIFKLIAENVGFQVPVVIRSIEELKTVVDQNPYPNHVDEGTKKLYVFFLSKEAPANALELLASALLEGENVTFMGNHIYFTTNGLGNSKFTNNIVDKKLGLTSTTRNWATTNKVIAL